MAELNVTPTRMELTRLKKKLETAQRGHKLLKDKRDELMRRFLDLVRENQALRARVEATVAQANKNFVLARAVMQDEALSTALLAAKQETTIDVGTRNVMSVDVPVFEFESTQAEGSSIFPYGFANTSGELDTSIEKLSKVFPVMLKLAAMEKEANMLAEEIEKTRRRVNALEYVKIPQYQETIRYIQMKLDEDERSTQTRLQKVKEMIAKDAIEEARQRDADALAELRRNRS